MTGFLNWDQITPSLKWQCGREERWSEEPGDWSSWGQKRVEPLSGSVCFQPPPPSPTGSPPTGPAPLQGVPLNPEGLVQNPFLPCVMWWTAELSGPDDTVEIRAWPAVDERRGEEQCQPGAGERPCVSYVWNKCNLMRFWKRVMEAVTLDTQT